MGLNYDWNTVLTIGGLLMTRILTVSSIIPFLVSKPVPNTIRTGFSLTMAVFLYPYLAPESAAVVKQSSMLFMMLLYFKEMFYGLAIGITASIIFHAFESAGSMVDNQRGAAQARLLIPQLGGESSIFGNLNYLLGISLFLSLNGHLYFLKALLESYDYLPLMDFPQSGFNFLGITQELIITTGKVLLLAVQLTAPILITIFVADVILGVMSKAAPSINVWELGFAVRGVMGVIIYFMGLGLLMYQMEKLSLSMIPDVQGIIRFLTLSGK